MAAASAPVDYSEYGVRLDALTGAVRAQPLPLDAAADHLAAVAAVLSSAGIYEVYIREDRHVQGQAVFIDEVNRRVDADNVSEGRTPQDVRSDALLAAAELIGRIGSHWGHRPPPVVPVAAIFTAWLCQGHSVADLLVSNQRAQLNEVARRRAAGVGPR